MRFDLGILRLVFISVLLQLVTQNSYAEGKLMDSTPKDNSVVSAFDNKVSLEFSGNVSERSPTLVVLDSTGKRVNKQDVTLTIGDRSILTTTTGNLAPGHYVVRYRVVTEDGLVVSGINRFVIKGEKND
jgi:copper resistance protein C